METSMTGLLQKSGEYKKEHWVLALAYFGQELMRFVLFHAFPCEMDAVQIQNILIHSGIAALCECWAQWGI